MADTVVKVVLGKLGDAAIKEILFLCGVEEQVEKVKRELLRAQAFLMDADRSLSRNERQRNWVKEVRDVAYSIEDVIDSAIQLNEDTETESLLKQMEDSRSCCFPFNTNIIKKMFRKSKRIPALHELGVEIDQILARIKEINENRVTYGIKNFGKGGHGTGSRLSVRPIVIPDIDDPSVIGFEEDTDNIVKLLLDESTLRRAVVSIVGTGGIGKTTLAHKAYNRTNIKGHFDKRIWVNVSKEFKLVEILKMIVKQFGPIDSSEHEEDAAYFLTKLHEFCTGKRYLIVLDDVWTANLWTQVEKALPDEENGSRVLMTSRSLDVAKEADPRSKPYLLKFLTEELSLELLLRKALPSQYPSKDYPNDFVGLAKQFVQKCGGLPLALVVLGGLLSKRSSIYAWSTLMQTMDWSVEGSVCIEILANSFEDLSLPLKSCFMYFAIFPEDFYIDAKALIRMWIAEGFIPELDKRTLEDTGESFLEELVQRCMIQAPLRSDDGSIDYCRIHDLLHDLAIQKANDDNFLVVSSNVDDLTNCCHARRLAIHHSNCDELMKHASKNLRSLVSFGSTPNCSKQRLLKVLRIEEIKLKMLEGLTQLRYIELNNWKADLSGDDYFQKFIGSLKFLQTLDLRKVAGHPDLPDCIWHLKKLRHIMLSEKRTAGPASWADLRNLQTLTGVKCRTSWSTEGIPNLPNLRELDLEIIQGLSWKTVATLLDTLKHLRILELISNSVLLEVPDMTGFSFYPHLQYLHMEGFMRSQGESSIAPGSNVPALTLQQPISISQLAEHISRNAMSTRHMSSSPTIHMSSSPTIHMSNSFPTIHMSSSPNIDDFISYSI